MAVALIVAAGSGERLGASRPKAFVMLAGRPMLEWSVAALAGVPAVDRVVVALPSGAQAPEGTVGVLGGPSRSESVRAALEAAGDGDPVLVHDAARPLVTAELVERLLAELDAGQWDAVVAAAPVCDTIKEAEPDGAVVATLDRGRLWAVQTPQVFRRAALDAALSGRPQALAAATDDASLVEANGGRVRVIEAPRENVKVTTPTDLRLAELLLDARAVLRSAP
jgi:2-C-methyl-D-erythritol 4-phosphate cytidylyltransferase